MSLRFNSVLQWFTKDSDESVTVLFYLQESKPYYDYYMSRFDRPAAALFLQVQNALRVSSQLQHALIRCIQQERNDMISLAIELPPESLIDPKSGRPIAEQIVALADMVEEADEADGAEEEAAIVEKCFWQLWALYEFLHSELTRSDKEVEALRDAAWEEIKSKRV